MTAAGLHVAARWQRLGYSLGARKRLATSTGPRAGYPLRQYGITVGAVYRTELAWVAEVGRCLRRAPVRRDAITQALLCYRATAQ